MAFIPHTLNEGGHPPFEYLPASAMTVELGMALDFASGKLTKASGTTVPKYFSLTSKVCEANEIIPVQKLEHGVDYETTASAAIADTLVGAKVTIATDGLRVTATTTDGIAQIVSVGGNAAGDKVVVRF